MSSVESIGDFAVNLIEQELESPTPTSRSPFTGTVAEEGQSDISDVKVSNTLRNQILNESFLVATPDDPDEQPQEQEDIPEIEISATQEPHIIHEHAALVKRFEGAVRELTTVLKEMTGSGFAGGGAHSTAGTIGCGPMGGTEEPREPRKSRKSELRKLLGKRK